MGIKDEFSTEQWQSLLQAPMWAGMKIISSDVGLTSVPKETMAMVRAVLENPIPAGADELVGALVDDMRDASQEREKLSGIQPKLSADNAEAVAQEVRARLQSTSTLVDEKLSPETAAAYKQWVYSVAQSVAEAGKEGGFLGIGAVRVSEQEEAALAALRQDLGLA